MNLLGEFSPLCPHGIQEIVGVSERDKAEGYILNISRYGPAKPVERHLIYWVFLGKRFRRPPP